MVGARTHPDEDVSREFLAHFRVVPLMPHIAEEAVKLRQEYRLKLPDAVIWASAISENCLLVSRNTKRLPRRASWSEIPVSTVAKLLAAAARARLP